MEVTFTVKLLFEKLSIRTRAVSFAPPVERSSTVSPSLKPASVKLIVPSVICSVDAVKVSRKI